MGKVCSNIECVLAGQTQSYHDKFCWKCGCKTVPRYRCACGRELEDVFEYCPKCGKNYTKGELKNGKRIRRPQE